MQPGNWKEHGFAFSWRQAELLLLLSGVFKETEAEMKLLPSKTGKPSILPCSLRS